MVEIVGARTQLRKVGARWTGRCPFHEERTPSFSVNAADKLFYCFGCGKKGDLITFVKETEGLDFVGAIEWLAERYRIPLAYEETSPQAEAEARAARAAARRSSSRRPRFYERNLWDSAAGAAGARVPGRARPAGGGLPRLPARALARRRGPGGEGARKGYSAGGAGRSRSRQPARERLLRRPARLPAGRRARPRARLRRAATCARTTRSPRST